MLFFTCTFRSVAVSKCLDTLGHSPPAMMAIQHCHGFGNNQLMRLNAKGQLGVGERCIEADSQGNLEYTISYFILREILLSIFSFLLLNRIRSNPYILNVCIHEGIP